MASSTSLDPHKKDTPKAPGHSEKPDDVSAPASQKGDETGKGLLTRAKEAGEGAGDKAGAMVSDAARSVGHKAEDAAAAAGHGIAGLGETVASNTPHEGVAGMASQTAAEGIKGIGHYLEEAKLSGMARDVERVVRNHPLPSILACLGIGFLLGRSMKA